MSILDDAIREHLELKRAHGADESELKKLEDEAFGPPGRPEQPDPMAEAPTEFMATPEAPAAPELESEEGERRRINIADLQEPPPAEPQAQPEPSQDSAPPLPAEDVAQAAPPAEEEPAAMEHEVVPEPPTPPPTPSEPTPEPEPEPDERQAIAEQPTELFDVEAEIGTEDAPAPPAEAPSPSDEEIVEAEREEPKLAPILDDEEEDDEFWSEQRLSDELDQALEGPITEEHELPTGEHEVSPAPIFDHEEDEGGEEREERPDYDPDTGHEDVLEDTPDFLEDAPEDDELWFEQRPPKDFDFDD